MFGYGKQNADLMIIDFSVSLSDDNANSYYNGRSGEILQKMIENVLELSINDIYLTHAVKCKPLNSNTPSESEYNSCKNYLFTQIEFVKPNIIITLGKEAYAKVTSENENFSSVRGHVIDFKNYKGIIFTSANAIKFLDTKLLFNLKRLCFSDFKTSFFFIPRANEVCLISSIVFFNSVGLADLCIGITLAIFS